MALLTPDSTYTVAGVPVNVKLIPDGARWTDAAKAKAAGFSAGEAYKNGGLICGTGKPTFITIHNTDDLANVHDDGEQYTRATWPNENMGSVRVHFYVDDTGAWQDLRAGTGMFPDDPEGKAEVGWHSGDGTVASGGNMTSIALEVIMGDTAEHDEKAKDNAARLAAWLLWKHGLPIDRLVTHTYWVAKAAGKTKANVDEQCTTMIAGKKWCPTYIFDSTLQSVALKNWKSFKELVYEYMDAISGNKDTAPPTAQAPAPSTGAIFRVRKTWADAASQIGAFSDLDNAKEFADKYPGYAVFDEAGMEVYPEAKEDVAGGELAALREENAALKAQIAAARKALE